MKTSNQALILMAFLWLGLAFSACSPQGSITPSFDEGGDPAPASSETGSAGVSSGDFGSAARRAQDTMLTLTLTSDKEAYQLGEPIVLTATLTNRGSEPAQVVPLFEPTYGFTTYTITYPGGERELFAPVWRDEGVAKLVTLGVGQSVSGPLSLYVRNTGVTFTRPGEYVVEGRYDAVKSPPVVVIVLPPENETQEQAAELMLNDDVAFFLFAGGGEHLKGAIDSLRRLIEEYPETILAGYANYALGVYYSKDGRDFEANTVRQADPAQADQFFKESLRTPLPEYYRIQSFSSLIETFVLMEDVQQAREFLKLFEGEFGDSLLAEFMLLKAVGQLEELR